MSNILSALGQPDQHIRQSGGAEGRCEITSIESCYEPLVTSVAVLLGESMQAMSAP